MILEDSGPVGGTFTHAGKTYQIKPNYFGTELLRKIKARMKFMDRENAKAILMDATAHSKLRQAAIMQALRSTVNTNDVLAAMSDLEILPVLIAHGCDIKLEEAEKIVEEYPDIIDLEDVMQQAAGLDCLKNSILLRLQRLQNEEANLEPTES